MKIITDITKPDFFYGTMKLFQPKLHPGLLSYLFNATSQIDSSEINSKDTIDKIESLVDNFAILDFLLNKLFFKDNDVLSNFQSLKIIDLFKHRFFTNEIQFNRQYSKFYDSTFTLEKQLNDFIKIPNGNITVSELKKILELSTKKFKDFFNTTNSLSITTERFKLHTTTIDKSIRFREFLSAAHDQNLVEQLKTNGVNNVMISIIQLICIKNNLSDITNEKVKELSEKIQKSINHLVNHSPKDVQLPRLRGIIGDTSGSSYFKKFHTACVYFFLNPPSTTSFNPPRLFSGNMKSEIEKTLDQKFSEDLRSLFIEISSFSGIDSNNSTRSLFFNKSDYPNIPEFILDKHEKSLVDLTFSTENHDLDVIRGLLMFQDFDKKSIHTIIDPSLKELSNTKVNNVLLSIENIQKKYTDLNNNYGELIKEYVSQSTLNEINYFIHFNKEIKSIDSTLTSRLENNKDKAFDSTDKLIKIIDTLSALSKLKYNLVPKKLVGIWEQSIEKMDLNLLINLDDSDIDLLLDNVAKIDYLNVTQSNNQLKNNEINGRTI
jgi:hypothetical protein